MWTLDKSIGTPKESDVWTIGSEKGRGGVGGVAFWSKVLERKWSKENVDKNKGTPEKKENVDSEQKGHMRLKEQIMKFGQKYWETVFKNHWPHFDKHVTSSPGRSPVEFGAVQQCSHIGSLPPRHVDHQHAWHTHTVLQYESIMISNCGQMKGSWYQILI